MVPSNTVQGARSVRSRCGQQVAPGQSAPCTMWVALSLVVLVSGCMSPQHTRFPTWFTWFPSAENAAYDRQHPFPDPDIGPSLDSTPRGYERPRTAPRKAAEQRLFQGLPVGPESVPPGVSRGGSGNSDAVR